MKTPKIVIVEAELIIALEMQLILNTFGFKDVQFITKTNRLLEKLEKIKPDILITETYFSDRTNIVRVIHKLRMTHPCEVIFVTALPDLAKQVEYLTIKPAAVLQKPYKYEDLRDAIMKIIHKLYHIE